MIYGRQPFVHVGGYIHAKGGCNIMHMQVQNCESRLIAVAYPGDWGADGISIGVSEASAQI